MLSDAYHPKLVRIYIIMRFTQLQLEILR